MKTSQISLDSLLTVDGKDTDTDALTAPNLPAVPAPTVATLNREDRGFCPLCGRVLHSDFSYVTHGTLSGFIVSYVCAGAESVPATCEYRGVM